MKINLMLAAGKGQRFRNIYQEPKPLISIDNKPMVIRSAEFLPYASQNIFICLQEHNKPIYSIGNKITTWFPEAKIIYIKDVTQGQASTCLFSKEIIHPESFLTISSCDCGLIYKEDKLEALFNEKDTDAVIWTFRNNPIVLRNPSAWGWVKVSKNGRVKSVSVKKPISNKLMNDHAVIGWFSFRKAKDCFKEIEKMINENDRINGEFYLDRLLHRLVESGRSVKVFEVDKYLGWGTPDDLKTYEKWKVYFKKRRLATLAQKSTLEMKEFEYWRTYFLKK